MTPEQIEQLNTATLQKIREKPGTISWETDPYYGFYSVSIFECPPFTMFTANDCPVAAQIIYNGSFETFAMKIWCRLSHIATGILDIGSHVGIYSLAAARLRPDLQIHAFEPNPYAFARLRLHKTLNGLNNLVENRFALSNKDGITRVYWFRKDTLSISSGGTIWDMASNETHDSAIAEMKRLDSCEAVKEIGPKGLIKIDVESTEDRVFKGMPKVIRQRPDILLECFSSVRADFINSIVQPLGYRAYFIDEETKQLILRSGLEKANSGSKSFNQLLTVRPEAELRALLT